MRDGRKFRGNEALLKDIWSAREELDESDYVQRAAPYHPGIPDALIKVERKITGKKIVRYKYSFALMRTKRKRRASVSDIISSDEEKAEVIARRKIATGAGVRLSRKLYARFVAITKCHRGDIYRYTDDTIPDEARITAASLQKISSTALLSILKHNVLANQRRALESGRARGSSSAYGGRTRLDWRLKRLDNADLLRSKQEETAPETKKPQSAAWKEEKLIREMSALRDRAREMKAAKLQPDLPPKEARAMLKGVMDAAEMLKTVIALRQNDPLSYELVFGFIKPFLIKAMYSGGLNGLHPKVPHLVHSRTSSNFGGEMKPPHPPMRMEASFRGLVPPGDLSPTRTLNTSRSDSPEPRLSSSRLSSRNLKVPTKVPVSEAPTIETPIRLTYDTATPTVVSSDPDPAPIPIPIPAPVPLLPVGSSVSNISHFGSPHNLIRKVSSRKYSISEDVFKKSSDQVGDGSGKHINAVAPVTLIKLQGLTERTEKQPASPQTDPHAVFRIKVQTRAAQLQTVTGSPASTFRRQVQQTATEARVRKSSVNTPGGSEGRPSTQRAPSQAQVQLQIHSRSPQRVRRPESARTKAAVSRFSAKSSYDTARSEAPKSCFCSPTRGRSSAQQVLSFTVAVSNNLEPPMQTECCRTRVDPRERQVRDKGRMYSLEAPEDCRRPQSQKERVRSRARPQFPYLKPCNIFKICNAEHLKYLFVRKYMRQRRQEPGEEAEESEQQQCHTARCSTGSGSGHAIRHVAY